MQETIDLIIKFGYVILFLYSLGGGFVALVGAGVLSSQGKLDISACIAIACVANFIGDAMLFWLARYQRPIMRPYFAKHRRKLALIHLLMRRFGAGVIVGKKYIYGLKTLVPIALAMTPYSFARFNLYSAVGALLWALSIGLVSYFGGGVMVEIFTRLGDYPYAAPVFLVLLACAIWLWLSKSSAKARS